MNPKDQSIIDVVNYLQLKYGAHNIIIDDQWDADLCAIGLIEKSRQYRGYISTWRREDKFYLALENQSTEEDIAYSTTGEFDNLDLNELESILAKHLRLVS